MNVLKTIVKDEPVILGGVVSGVGVYLGIRYGAHVNGATQIFPGVSVATFVAFLSRFVGPSAPQDVQGIVNDVTSIKEQIAPLTKVKGWQNAVGYLASHGKEVMAIVEAAKTDVEDLLHHGPKVSSEPPTTTSAPVTLTQPGDVQVTTEPPVPTVAEPTAAASQAQLDAVTELAKLVP